MIETHLDAAAATLLERSADLRELDGALAGAAGGRGRLILVEGEPGIGKSSLLEAALRLAEVRSMGVLRAAPGEMESGYSYGLALELFGRVLARSKDREALLVGAAAHVAPILASGAPSTPVHPVDPFPIVHGLYWLTVALAERRPLLIAVDDAQWADPASLRFLVYLAQRVTELPIALVAALRPRLLDEPAELSALRLATRDVVRPRRLTLTGVRDTIAMLRPEDARLRGDAGVVGATDEAFVAACHRATRGNPFYLRELLRQLEPASHLPAAVDELAPDLIARRVASRVAALGEAARRVAGAVAIFGADATLERISRLVGIETPAVAVAIDRLIAAGLVESGTSISFVHPIVRTCVDRAMPEQERALAHRGAATILADGGDPWLDAVATHLLAAPPDSDARVVEMLLRAARTAAARGSPGRAVACLLRAEREPPPPELRTEVLLDLGRALALGGDGVGGADALGRAALLIGDDAARGQILCEQGEAFQAAGRWDLAAAAFDRALAEAPGAPASQRGRMQAGYVAAAWLDRSQHAEAERRADSILALPGGAGDAPLVALWTAYQRSIEAVGGHQSALSLVNEAVDGVPISELQAMGQAVELAAGTLLATDSLDQDVSLLSAAMEEAQAAGSIAKYAVASYCRAWPHLHAGRLREAVADAQAAVDALDSGWEMFYPAACAVLGLALIERGDVDAAASVTDLDPGRWASRLDYLVLIPLVRGRIQLARGDLSGAVRTLRDEAGKAVALGIRNPDMSPWRSWCAIALAGLGDRDAALELAEEELAIARDWGAPRQVGVALRAVGLASGGDAGIERLRSAVAVLDRSAARLELARATCDLGAMLRRAGRRDEARRHLADAADLAERCGATAILERAADELRSAGARPRRYAVSGPASLTPSELRVARLAAAGRTNREVAQALFVTLKAVEFHLANAYRKLAITSRRELSGALADESAAGSATGKAD